jgi:FkbM family methyltransferase
MIARGSLEEFLHDIEPFFYGKGVTYVDVGAYVGKVFRKVGQSGLRLREIHLIEPNPAALRTLTDVAEERRTSSCAISVHPIALGAHSGKLRFKASQSMTQVLASESAELSDAANVFEAESKTLDDLAVAFTEEHVSLLKVDVEGFEDRVLAGAERLLAEQRIDVIYIEVGMNPGGTQQCYHRVVDDLLLARGYRLFKVYEQTHEWITDSPLLRRVNCAYMSERFAAQHPYKLTRELFEAQRNAKALEAELLGEKARFDAIATKHDRLIKEASEAQQRIQRLETEQRENALEAELRARLDEREKAALGERLAASGLAQQRDQLELARERARVEVLTTERDELRTTNRQSELSRLSVTQQLSEASQEIQRLLELLEGSNARAALLEVEREDLTLALRKKTQQSDELERSHVEQQGELDELRALATVHRAILAELATARQQLALLNSPRGSKSEPGAEEHASPFASGDLLQVPGEIKEFVARLQSRCEETERMSREIYRLFVDSRNRERKARAEVALALERIERTRQHLSYRLGAALLENSRTPLGWFKAPGALRRAYEDFTRERSNRSPLVAPRLFDVLAPTNPLVVMPLAADWQQLVVQAKNADSEVWVHVLSVTSGAVASTELVLEVLSGAPVTSAVEGESLVGFEATGFPVGRLLKLRAGRSRLLFRVTGSGELALKVRKIRGEPSILRLELRPLGGAVMSLAEGQAGFETGSITWEDPSGLSGSRLAAMVVRKQVKKGPGGNTLLTAFNRIQEGEQETALAFAAQHADNDERAGIHLLRCLLVHSDESAWLACLNQYLLPFGVAPLALAERGHSRFQRLRARTVRRIEQGPLVSVIMPAFNAGETLEFAATSVLNQTWRNLELIIVDDASSDTTWSIAKSLAAADDRVRILRNVANVGPYVSKNIGLRVAAGEYVTGHDADDWAHPERVEAHLAAMRASGPNVRASLAGMLRMTTEGRLTRFAPRGPNTHDGALVAGFISALFEARFLKQVLGGWDTVRFAGDSELIARAERVTGGPLPRFAHLGMICLDSPVGLTNHPEFGYSPALGMSTCRKAYRESFKAWHETVTPGDAYLPFPHVDRFFALPPELTVDSAMLAATVAGHTRGHGDQTDGALRGPDVCDVCLVTDLRLPGGNASSTIEEVRLLRGRGLSVLLVHCPSSRTQGKPISSRYDEFREICLTFHDVTKVEASVLIVRHPAVASSPKFKWLGRRIHARSCAVIVNNSIKRSDGELVYSAEALLANIATLKSQRTSIFPLGPAIRRELLGLGLGVAQGLAADDWTPTFDAASFPFKPKPTLATPFVIGRHARDGAEKWLEDRHKLLGAYPDHSDFSVCILGGADAAATVAGGLPANWQVLPFGSMEPAEYLAKLDVFVYFPHSGLNEAFGRAIMEAIFAGVPCVVPRSFRTTFEDMVFYSDPENVAGVVRRLSGHPQWRLDFLKHARERAKQYESTVLTRRLARLEGGAEGASEISERAIGPLTGTVREYKAWVETGHWNAVGVSLGSEH